MEDNLRNSSGSDEERVAASLPLQVINLNSHGDRKILYVAKSGKGDVEGKSPMKGQQQKRAGSVVIIALKILPRPRKGAKGLAVKLQDE